MATTNQILGKTVTKKELVDRICTNTKLRRNDVRDVVQAFLDQVVIEIGKGNRLEFRDFGVYEVKRRAPRVAQNPKTLERVQVPAKRTVKFKPGRLMRAQLETADKAELAPEPTPLEVQITNNHPVPARR